jgi:hypothetical protein
MSSNLVLYLEAAETSILILFLQVVKNRYDGELGALTLKFDKEYLGFAGSESKPKNRKKTDTEVSDETDSKSDLSETIQDRSILS